MTNEIIELLEQSEYGIIAINEPNIFLDVCLPAEGCASDVAIWYDDNKKCKAISIYKVDYQKEENTQNQVVARAKAVHHCFAIYNALGLNKTGEAEIEDILVDTPEIIWERTKEKAGIDKRFFDRYYAGRNQAVAYKLKNITEYEMPKELKDYGISRAPQSFQYVK